MCLGGGVEGGGVGVWGGGGVGWVGCEGVGVCGVLGVGGGGQIDARYRNEADISNGYFLNHVCKKCRL